MGKQHIDHGSARIASTSQEPRSVTLSVRRDPFWTVQTLETAYQKVLQEMRDILAEFHKEFPPVPGHKGYMLSGYKCGKKGCRDCPHGVFWREYTCARIDWDIPNLTIVPDMAESQVNRSGFQQVIPMPAVSEAIPVAHKQARGGLRRTKVFWHKTPRRKHLPGSFFANKKRLSEKNFIRIRYYHDRVLLLNKQRESLVRHREQILHIQESLLKNSLFKELIK